MSGLAGSIDSPVGIDKTVDDACALGDRRAGLRLCAWPASPADVLLGQIHRRPVEIKHGEVALGTIGHHSRRLGAVFSTQQRSVEMAAAFRVRHHRGEIFPILGDQGQANAADRLGGLQGAGDHIKGVGGVIGLQRHVGEQDPAARLGRLGRLDLPVPLGLTAQAGRVPRLDHIGARFQGFQHRAEGEHRRRPLVRRTGHGHVARPDLAAVVPDAVIALIVAVFALRRRLRRTDGLAHQITVGDAVDVDVQARDVDGLQPHPIRIFPRQDHAFSGEADIDGLRACCEGDVSGFSQHMTGLRRQAAQKRDGATGIADIGDAELIA